MKITHGNGGEYLEQGMDAPPLFPHIRRLVGDDRHRYILDELEKMISAGEMSLTAIFQQPSVVRDAVGLALKGVVVDPDTHSQRQASIPYHEHAAVFGHAIKVRVIPGRAETVRYKSAMVDDPRPLQGTRGVTADINAPFRRIIKPKVAKVIDYETPEADMPLTEAWVCLAQHGKHCKPARSLKLQSKHWIYEEAPRTSQRPQRAGK